MGLKKKKTREKFKIEELLNCYPRGSKSEYSRELWVCAWAINHFFRRWAKTIWKQKKYTEVFNRCFMTDYSYKELFSNKV